MKIIIEHDDGKKNSEFMFSTDIQYIVEIIIKMMYEKDIRDVIYSQDYHGEDA